MMGVLTLSLSAQIRHDSAIIKQAYYCSRCSVISAQSSVYDFTVKDDAGQDVSLAEYKGKVNAE